MSRRARELSRAKRAQQRAPRDRMARVQITDETWAAFRAQLGVTPVSVALGRLVNREVGRAVRRSASDVEQVRIALEDARDVASELASLIARLERGVGAKDAPVHDPEPVSDGGNQHWSDNLHLH